MSLSEIVPRAGDGAPENAAAPSTPMSSTVPSMPPRQVVSSRASSHRGASNAALSSGRRWRHAARWVGLLIFIFGAGLLAYVFREALTGFQQFSEPDYLSKKVRRVQGDGWEEIILSVAIAYGAEFLRVAYLVLLGVLGSMIAGKGVQFFAASESVIDEAVVPDYNELP